MAERLSKAGLEQRLSGYWKMEAANVAFIPAIMLFLAVYAESRLGWLSIAAMVPMCLLLALGAAYWRAKLQVIRGEQGALEPVLSIAHRADLPLAVASTLALILALVSWLAPQLSVSLADRVAASVAGSLAVLEYINYYHRQLQHFDHAADIKRLLGGKGFRPSQMGRDLAEYRKGL